MGILIQLLKKSILRSCKVSFTSFFLLYFPELNGLKNLINRAFPGAYSCSMKFTFLFFLSFLNCKHGSGANIIFSSCKDYLPVLQGSAQAGEGKDTFAVRFPCSKNVPEAVALSIGLAQTSLNYRCFLKQLFSFVETQIPFFFFYFFISIQNWYSFLVPYGNSVLLMPFKQYWFVDDFSALQDLIPWDASFVWLQELDNCGGLKESGKSVHLLT